MAAGGRNWREPAAVALLWLCGAATVCAQASQGTGSMAGRLTDLHSRPLGGATLVLRNLKTGAEQRTTTARNGSYQFAGLEPGEYRLRAESAAHGQGELGEILVDAGHTARVQAAMDLQPAAPASAGAAVAVASSTRPPLTPPEAAQPLVEKRAEASLAPPRPVAAPASANVSATAPLPSTPPAATPPAAAAPTAARPKPELATAERRASPTLPPAPPSQPRPPAPKPERAVVAEGIRPTPPTAPPQPPPQQIAVAPPPALATVRPEPAPPPAPAAVLPPPPVKAVAVPSAAEGANAAKAALELSRKAALAAALRARAELIAERQQDASLPSLTGEELQSFSVSGRRWQDFALDADSSAASDSTHGRAFMREGPGGQAEVSVDGAPVGTAFGSTGGRGRAGAAGADEEPVQMGRSWSDGQGLALSEPAVGRLRTGSRGLASGAGRGGNQFDVETRHGSNGWHGQGFVFGRRNLWGARNPFSQWVKETAPATATTTPVFTAEPYTPKESEVSWGLGMGRHIRRDRLFWFAALDHLGSDNPGMATAKHPETFFAQPSNDEAQMLAARLDLTGNDPVTEGLAAYGKMLETLDGLMGPTHRTAAQWTGFAGVDWELAERHRLTLEAAGARWDSPGGGLRRTSEPYGSHSFGTSRASELWILGRWEAFVTPNLLAATEGSAGRTLELARPETPSAWEQSLLAGNAWGRLPQISADPASGFTLGNPARFGQGAYPDEHRYTAQERVDWAHGNLLLRGGFELDHVADAVDMLRNQTGTYHYSRVENFVSDALVFAKYGIGGQLNPYDQHNCDIQGKAWRDTGGELRGLGYLPCYTYFTQRMGPSDWRLSTNRWAGYVSAQWQPAKWMVASAGLRWERQQLPPPIARLANAELPLAGKMPDLGNNWGPRFSLAVGSGEGHWPVLRLGAGEYFAPLRNLTLLGPLTETGSLKGDLRFFMRPTDNLAQGGAPPFPYALSGEPVSVVKPSTAEFGPGFRNGEVEQAMAGIEEKLPWHLRLDASAAVSLGRRLPVSVDTNIDPAVNPGTFRFEVIDPSHRGPIKTPQITVPLYGSWPSGASPTKYLGRLNPDYQQIVRIASRANSTYEAAMVRLERSTSRGLGFRVHYTYGHAMDWNPNESGQLDGSTVFDPGNFRLEYGTGDLDLRHSVSVFVFYEAPWKLKGLEGKLGNGWRVSGTGQYRSGMAYTMRTMGQLPRQYENSSGMFVVGLATGMNGSGGDNRVYGVGRNTFRYPQTWNADLRLAKSFNLGKMRELELLAESFNLFNHRNVTELETIGYTIGGGGLTVSVPTLTYNHGQKTSMAGFGQPLNVNATNFFRERQIQFGLRVRF